MVIVPATYCRDNCTTLFVCIMYCALVCVSNPQGADPPPSKRSEGQVEIILTSKIPPLPNWDRRAT
jgi:hypothetical protein